MATQNSQQMLSQLLLVVISHETLKVDIQDTIQCDYRQGEIDLVQIGKYLLRDVNLEQLDNL